LTAAEQTFASMRQLNKRGKAMAKTDFVFGHGFGTGTGISRGGPTPAAERAAAGR